ncbi:hypothetical protein [Rhodococcus sp. 077-4]|uniref:hypothetical protein n=1 Tax=Rhodococcus sp. 077-4 TaxID=2789271 RepID=UPI0039F60A1E
MSVQPGTRQCSNDTHAWHDGSAYRVNGRRIGRSSTARAVCIKDYDGERQGPDPDDAEPA